MPTEADVVWSLKNHLLEEGLSGRVVTDITVDSNGSYRQSPHREDLEPMMSICIDGFYPDLVCLYPEGNDSGIAAFEVKGRFQDWPTGVTQARAYRKGAHSSYLALPYDSPTRIAQLERDAGDSGVALWFLENEAWREAIAPSPPQPDLRESSALAAALTGVVLPRRMNLNHPLNYLTATYLVANAPDGNPSEVPDGDWGGLQSTQSKTHAIHGARYLGLLTAENKLTRRGLMVVDLLKSVGYDKAESVNTRPRFCRESPPLAAVSRVVLMEQESTKLIVDALQQCSDQRVNTEDLMRVAHRINKPLTAGLFLTDPRNIDRDTIPSECFNPSFVFKFKQALWHAGILATSKHPTAGKAATDYRHDEDYWQLEEPWTSL